jgi:hypothetical protein
VICDKNSVKARELSAMYVKQTMRDRDAQLKGENL